MAHTQQTSNRKPRRGFFPFVRAIGAGAVALLMAVAVLPAAPTDTKKPSGETTVAGTEWPQWRGPNRDDHSSSTGLLKEWPAGGPKLLWKASGIGGGFSSVSFGAGKIFTMGDQADAAFVYALDQNGGKIVWSAKVGKPGGEHPGTRCTPTFDGDHVYALGQFGDLVCLATDSGKEIWRKSMKGDFGGAQMSKWGYAESPLVDGERLIITPGGQGGTMAALNKKTGQVIWRSKEWTDTAGYSSVIVIEYGGKRQYVQVTGESVAGVEADGGKLLWRAARKGKTAVVDTPIFDDGIVYVTSSYDIGNDAFKVAADGGNFKTSPLYTHDQNKGIVNHHGGVILVDGYLYGHSDAGGWTCVDFKTGKVMWQHGGGGKGGRRGAGGAAPAAGGGGGGAEPGKGSVTYADGHLYLRNESGPGTVFLIEASPKGYKEHGHFDQPDRSRQMAWAHPVVADGKLYLRDDNNLFCYDVKAH